MGFHQYNTNFTLDPRIAMTEHKNVSRGLGNQVTVEFNLLYRFHCAISLKDEAFAENFMREMQADYLEHEAETLEPGTFTPWDHEKRQREVANLAGWDPTKLSLNEFIRFMQGARPPFKEPWEREFGLRYSEESCFKRNAFTGLFDDQKMIAQLQKDMEDPISNFGPRNIPKVLRNVELMGIAQARKWEIGTLNDFRDFFGMKRHKTFDSITKNEEVQNALRDLYDHPDKVELYPGIFCESDKNQNVDPGPSDTNSALWAAIFSDAITLVRSDRFYTVDWNTNSLTSWGMKEVTPDNDVLKSSVFHRLLQRAFPEWFPYDSVRFFHPFYTAETNAKFAQEQGYGPEFQFQVQEGSRSLFSRQAPSVSYDVTLSNAKKPLKPLYLSTYSEVKALLAQKPDRVVNPAFSNAAMLPDKVGEVLAGQARYRFIKDNDGNPDKASMTMAYFTNLMREIVKREIIAVDKLKPIYQIDVTRELVLPPMITSSFRGHLLMPNSLAIPVITRYIADFLGFGDRIRANAGSTGTLSENEIYQHITNCQVYSSYNADETKLLKRRKAFKVSHDSSCLEEDHISKNGIPPHDCWLWLVL